MKNIKYNLRSTNFELLRIISMLMIVAHHYAFHGVLGSAKNTIVNTLNIEWTNSSLFNNYFTSLLLPGGLIGVALFFMITGYFQVNKDKFSLKKLLLETMFYAWVISLLGMVITIVNGDIPFVETSDFLKSILKSLFIPLTGDLWWFATTYVFLMLISPLLNNLFRKLQKKTFSFY